MSELSGRSIMQTSKIIVIAGPTASGKSGLALDIAKETKGTVINADSMQVYKDIPILAASPSKEDIAIAPHKLYGIYDASVRGNVVDWLNLCKQEILEAQNHNSTPVIVGGTGMYIEALTKGVTPIPETPQEVRNTVEEIISNERIEFLYHKLQKIDKDTANKLSENDTTRIKRAMEVWYHTGKNLTYWHSIPLINHFNPQDFIKIYIKPPREVLDIRGKLRFDIMMKQGALSEVEKLVERNLSDSLPAMRALGVQELKSYILGKMSLTDAIEEAKLHTRQYAKRQSTWFNNRFDADFCLNTCYDEDKNFVEDIKNSI
jgi:tRNA dimethylallyltransferase